MKKYIVKFTYLDGNEEEVEFLTDRIDWSIAQYKRNRAIESEEILNESRTDNKKMLFG